MIGAGFEMQESGFEDEGFGVGISRFDNSNEEWTMNFRYNLDTYTTQMSYKNLDIYKISFNLFLKAHKASFLLPKYELFELGSQLRRSSDSVITNIVEGYGRSVYKNDYIRFLVFSHASNDETINHLDKIIALYPEFSAEFGILKQEYDLLGGKINNYKKWVKENWIENKP